MKLRFLLPLIAIAFSPALKAQEATEKPTQKPADAPTAPVAEEVSQELWDKVSYFYGTRVANDLGESGMKINKDIFADGFKDVFEKKPLKYTEDEIKAFLAEFSKIMMAKQEKETKAAVEQSDKFLTDNAKREGVTTTASGLQYEVLKKGDGPLPKAEDTVSVHYVGTLVDGKEFDSSIKRGEPATFPVGGVIPGWVEALQLMPVGSKYKLFIPSKLAYGEQGAGPDIGPNSTLIFEVELLKIEPKQ